MKAAAMIALAMCGATGTAAFQIPVVTRQATGAAGSALQMAQPAAGTGTGPSLQYNPEKYTDEKNKGNYRKLSEALEVSHECVACDASYHAYRPFSIVCMYVNMVPSP